MGSFELAGNRSLPETECERGSKQRKQVLCLIPELRITRKVARELRTKPSVRNNFGNKGCIGESGFDPVELWVMGPPCGLKVGGAVTSFMVMIARCVRG